MPFTSQWSVENRIILTQIAGKLTAEEAGEMSAAHAKFLDAGKAPVHLIVDVTQIEVIPTNLRQNMSMGGYLKHPALGWTVMVGGTKVVNFMVSMLSQVFHIKYARRETIPEALTFLSEQDSTLVIEKAASSLGSSATR